MNQEMANIISTILKLAIIAVALAGLFLNSGIIQKKFRMSMFIYFTNLSLVFCFLYFTASIAFKGGAALSCANGFVILAVTLTMAVFHFVLRPSRKRKATDYRVHFADVVAHYAAPTLVIADWLMFAEKGAFAYYYPLLWGIPFAVYFFMTIIYAKCGGYLEYAESRYPYYFLDFDKAGVKKVWRNNIVLLFAVIALGYSLLALDILLGL